MKNLVTSLVLLLIVAVVGGWIYFNERGPIAQTGSTVLLRAEPQSVTSLALLPSSGTRLEFTREDSSWQVHRVGTQSVAVPADEDAIDELLKAAELLQSGGTVDGEDAAKLKEFGLDKPHGTLIINDAKIEFGAKPSFDSSKIYARVTNGSEPQVALLPANLADFTARPFNEWRDKSALHVKAEDATALKVTAPALKGSFERILKGENGEEDQWRMLTPIEGRADAGTIRALLEQLALTKTPRFLEDNPKNLAQWGLEKPIATVEVTTDKGVSTLNIGKPVSGGRVAQNSISRVVFVVPDSLLGIISRPLRDWRDRILLRFSTEDVQNLSVAARGKQAKLARDNATWKLENTAANAATNPPTEKSAVAISQAAMDVMIGLQGLSSEDFIDKPQILSAYGLDKPALEVELFSSEWGAPKKVRLGLKAGKVYAQVSEDGGSGGYPPTVSVLAPNALEPFKLALDALFNPRPDTSEYDD